MNEELQHLRLLSIFHYVVGGLAALLSCFPVIYLATGIAFVVVASRAEDAANAPPAVVGWVFALLGGVMMLLGWAFAACVIIAGRFLARRVHHTFCLVMGGIDCLFMPFGTVLGVFTIIVLMKPSVRALFEGGSPEPAPEAEALS